jgi:hypothetical protein
MGLLVLYTTINLIPMSYVELLFHTTPALLVNNEELEIGELEVWSKTIVSLLCVKDLENYLVMSLM